MKAPLYVGVFAEDPKEARKEVLNYCREGLTALSKQYEDPQIFKDRENIQTAFSLPMDNTHITSLFVGNNPKKLSPKAQKELKSFQYGQKTSIDIKCMVYVPGIIMIGYCPDTHGIAVSNAFPHCTLLLGPGVKAKESNGVLEELMGMYQQLKNQKQYKNGKYELANKEMKVVYIYEGVIVLKAISGDNVRNGKWS